MKINKKKLTNKEITERTNILLVEQENIKHVFDTFFMTFTKYLEYKNEKEDFAKYIKDNNKENKDV